MRNPSSHRSAAARIGLRFGVGAVGLLVLATIVLLPFAVRSALDDLTTPPTPRLYRLGPPQQPAPQHLRIHLIVSALDVVQQTATINVTAYQVCPTGCPEAYELMLISAFAEGPHDEGVPPLATVRIPAEPAEQKDSTSTQGYELRERVVRRAAELRREWREQADAAAPGDDILMRRGRRSPRLSREGMPAEV